MADALDRLCRTDQATGTAAHDLSGLTNGMAAADRAGIGKDKWLAVSQALLRDRVQHLRDDVPGTLDHYRIADPHILALDLVLIMQGGTGHHDPANGDRLQMGNRCQSTGAPHLNIDLFQYGLGLFGGQFVGDGPARCAADKAHAVLIIEAVQLVDNAVNVEGQAGPLRLHMFVKGHQLRNRAAEPFGPVQRKAPARNPLAGTGLGAEQLLCRFADHAPAIAEEAEFALGGDFRVELAQ